jgi:hypothetical protein
MFALIISSHNLGSNVCEATPDIDRSLHLLGILLWRVLQPNSVALPLEVRHDTIDQGQRTRLVEWSGCEALVCQLRRHSRRCDRALRCDSSAHRRARATAIVTSLERRGESDRRKRQTREGVE